MKKILILFLVTFLLINPVYAQDESRMLRDDGSTSGSGGSSVRKTNKALLDVLKSLFSGSASNSSSLDKSSNSSPGSTTTDGSTIDPNINTTATDITSLLNNNGITYPANLTAAAQVCLKNIGVYKQVQQSQGIPWQVLAGIHYREGGCNPNQSPVGGRVIGQAEPDVKSCSSQENGLGKPKALKQGGCGFDNLLDATTYAALHLKGKIGGVPQTHAQLVAALSKFNGGGNSNCRGGTPYTKCPPASTGFDDAYVFNKNPGEQTMFLRFCADGVKCNPPREFSGIGVIPIAGAINQLAGANL